MLLPLLVATVGDENVAMRREPKKVAKGLYGDYRAGEIRVDFRKAMSGYWATAILWKMY